MAAATLLALLDDIASVLDDVSVLTKVAAKKTAGVLGDDLALNAQQAAGVRANRELPVVWAVAKGSLVNKAILVPAALAISAIAPWAIVPLLMAGGLFLCFEGFEKIWHLLAHRAQVDEHRQELHEAIVDSGARPCFFDDYGYEAVFARQVAAFGLPGDVLVAFSTSGRSANVVRAAQEARQRGMRVGLQLLERDHIAQSHERRP